MWFFFALQARLSYKLSPISVSFFRYLDDFPTGRRFAVNVMLTRHWFSCIYLTTKKSTLGTFLWSCQLEEPVFFLNGFVVWKKSSCLKNIAVDRSIYAKKDKINIQVCVCLQSVFPWMSTYAHTLFLTQSFPNFEASNDSEIHSISK